MLKLFPFCRIRYKWAPQSTSTGFARHKAGTSVTTSAPGRSIRAPKTPLSLCPFIKQGQFRDIVYSGADTQAGTKHPVPVGLALALFECSKAVEHRGPAGLEERSPGSGSGHSAGTGAVRRQRHGRQEHGLELARHAGDLRVLRLVRLDQPGELQDPCERRAGKDGGTRTPAGPALRCATHLRRRC